MICDLVERSQSLRVKLGCPVVVVGQIFHLHRSAAETGGGIMHHGQVRAVG
jgi:hypothetical protein